jgi:hypothetical protein
VNPSETRALVDRVFDAQPGHNYMVEEQRAKYAQALHDAWDAPRDLLPAEEATTDAQLNEAFADQVSHLVNGWGINEAPGHGMRQAFIRDLAATFLNEHTVGLRTTGPTQ